MGNFRYLPDTDIQDLYSAAIATHLTTQQDALLSGLSPAYVAGLPTPARLDARLLQTLHELNRTPELMDGTVPLVAWLRNAKMLTDVLAEGRVFATALLKVQELVEQRRKSVTVSTPPLNPASNTGKPPPLRLFISYAKADKNARERLEVYLSSLKREGLIQPWHKQMIEPGAEPAADIDHNLTTAEIVLLLVSQDFIASEDCFEKELKLALERHEAGSARVIPILVAPTDVSGMPFAKLKPLPSNDKAVSSWRNADEAWLDVVRGIRRVVEALRAKAAATP